MAPPMTAAQFATVLRAAGVIVVEVDDWEHHNRNHMGPWGPVHGVMFHHTVTKGSARTVAMCRDGYTGLPGPLCHGVITKDGRVHLVGYGRANHAGLGDDDVLRAIIDERALPVDDEANTDGNRHFYGFECENLGDGADPWPAAQLLAIERVAAAICRHHGWGAESAFRHLDWQPGKVDPRGIDWRAMQTRVAVRLGSTTPVPSPPAPSTPVVSLSKLRAAALSDPERSGTPVSYKGVITVEAALVDRGLLAARYSDGHWGTKTTPAYEEWQRSKAGGSYTGDDADGIPGRDSLRRLGLAAGFKVVD
ncbi:N-acetylmuramoyl-L-alanine amidase [Streptomyces scabiei]|uniref:N-acetylmuramoyl-L-alanine amidase n=1 Tax=Streptomyces scabiei TaxID=1930 RepID=UPI001B31C3B0|nr:MULTISPECIES: N-acetylmuramoyl-L-alanine amidase [Streptomyces]MDX2538891.1 N-acetylmuramoyl-L-alanine amidase [Streptomyces scabiei]MDX2801868.1 N-acetylmuramoyl-L-alanine amidase [Streptomyces scabiei]MDX3295043.1 N-acetylmuramoyl-L-alanine amidase [Streptomyces scabiei]MDX3829049.1 N-acetylmuramoyl-L-alanine amidase [Streptomyces scabiei]